MFSVIEVPKEQDLRQFSRLLWQRKISHRIHALDDRQIVAVSKLDHGAIASLLYQQWRQGEVAPTEEDRGDVGSWFRAGDLQANVLRAFLRTPLTLILIIICVVLALVAPLNSLSDTVRLLLYPDFSYGTRFIHLQTVLDNFTLLQFAKMISPIFLHAGAMHLAFNMLWLWEFGKRIEAAQASWTMLPLIAALALVSNTMQYLSSGSINFGGMSGVVYGLFAYIWICQSLAPAKRLHLPGALIFFMLASLAVLTLLGLENIAHVAHLGGLLCGALCGVAAALAHHLGNLRRR